MENSKKKKKEEHHCPPKYSHGHGGNFYKSLLFLIEETRNRSTLRVKTITRNPNPTTFEGRNPRSNMYTSLPSNVVRSVRMKRRFSFKFQLKAIDLNLKVNAID